MVDKTPRKRKSRKELVADLKTQQQPPQTDEVCLVPGCDKHPAARGMCVDCYNTAKRNIYRGNATWEEFIEAGLARQPHAQSSLVMDALRKHRESTGKPTRTKRAASKN